MIVVKIELHSAVTGQITEIGRAIVCNVGGTQRRGDYRVAVARRGVTDNRQILVSPQRAGEVKNYPRLAYNVWRLIARAVLAAFPEEARYARAPEPTDGAE